MTALQRILTLVLVAGCGTALWLGASALDDIDAEIAAHEGRLEKGRASRAEYESLRGTRPSKDALISLRAAAEEAESARIELAKPLPESPAEVLRRERSAQATQMAPLPAGFLPVTRYTDEGLATPHAAANTLTWAMASGETERLKAALLLPPDLRARLEQVTGGAAAGNNGAPGATPEDLVAGYLTLMYGRMTGASLNVQSRLDRTLLVAQYSTRTGKNTRMVTLLVPQSDGTWKAAVSPALVKLIISDQTRRAKTAETSP